MGITMTAMGRSGKPGRFFFIPKGALTHHRAVGPAVVSLPLVGSCALRGGLRSLRRAPGHVTGSADSGCHSLRGRIGTPFLPPAKTCHRQFYRRDGRCLPAPSIFFCLRQKKQKRFPAGQKGRDYLWPSTILKQKS